MEVSMSQEDERKLQLDVHVSEYQAVTNRSTYYTAISSAVWPVIGVYLTVIAMFWTAITRWKYGTPLAVWVSAGIVQSALLAWASVVHEQYMMVLYIEKHLRPLVQKAVATPCFWMYEPFNTARRGSGLYFWWELSVPFAMLFALLATACLRIAFAFRECAPIALLIDSVGLLVNSVLLWVLFRTGISIVHTRSEWERSERDVIEQCYSGSQASKQDQQASSKAAA
jgi:hypothetical protein